MLVHGGSEGPALLASMHEDGRANRRARRGIATLLAPAAAAPAAAAPAAVAPAQAPGACRRSSRRTRSTACSPSTSTTCATCAIDEIGRNPELAQLRIAFIAESDGATHALSFAPNTPSSWTACTPRSRPIAFRVSAAGRQVATYVFSLRAPRNQPRRLEDGTEHHCWDFYAAQADAAQALGRGRAVVALASMARADGRAQHARAATAAEVTQSKHAEVRSPHRAAHDAHATASNDARRPTRRQPAGDRGPP